MTKKIRSAFGVVMAVLTITFSVGCPDNPVQPTPPMPTASITCDGKTTSCDVLREDSAIIAWTSANVTGTCRVTKNGIDTGWTGNSGSQSTGSLTATATYSVDCPSVTTTPVVVNVVAPARLRLISGLSGSVVSGATVIPDGADIVFSASDGWATVRLSESASFNVAIDVAGHWGPYESRYSPSRGNFLLWPITGANTGDAIKQMVFGDSSGYNNPGLTSMRRLDGPVSFYFDPDLASNSTIVARYRSAASVLQAVIGFGVTVGSTMPIAGTSGFRVYIDPSLQYQAVTHRDVSRGRITGGYMAFRTLDNLTDYVIRHEMGHVFGLWHHMGEGLVGEFTRGTLDYSQSEKENMHIMLKIMPGTTAPYNDRSAFTTSAQSFSGTIVVGCNFDHR
ncbi:MAG: hypothetical protein UT53_C0015G0002 [Candidatus Yanofskybacteria bacterium GW2011_GWD2_39_48]|uniref:Peptidase M10 metallopeptidase domain-containing protein n=1 Tax=Candidatus Yanofskybacteria bacterium GW2011_GWD2_39_48 TaxID=1619031 RepID=A0A0G0P5I8_9BACT|nr:MAG: hypothetical protein UT53_C0015G0002 [Candidatus Yanofskybacteria bacterium GW2011_GWD2_39_48]